ncbi:SMC family ATPase [archaeon]|nr:SMC family ATPase [archaeon]
MILKSIRLKNIRSYTEQRIEFPSGSILLAGDIGSGKSSILHAVEFALFGARRDSISGEALLRKGEKSGEVEMMLELDGKEVSVKRTLKKQQDSVSQEAGHISVGGEVIEGTATELKARMLQLLGYPKELLTKSKSLIYRYTVYTPQEEMKQIIFDDAESRVDTLRKVFGIDRYKRISENALIFIRQMKERRKELTGMMQGIDEKKSELARRKSELESVGKTMQELLPMLEKAKSSKSAKKAEVASIEKKINELHELRKRSEVCDARLQEIARQRNKNNEELAGIETEISRLKRQLESIFLDEKQYPPAEQLEKELSGLEREINEVNARKTELAERARQLNRRVDELGKELESKSAKTSVAEEKERLYKELLEEIKDKEAISISITEMNSRLKAAEAAMAELLTHTRK